MLHDDFELTRVDVQGLSGRDALAAFFARLGYDTNERLAQSVAAMGFTSDALKSSITHIERLASQDAGTLDVYLIELKSVTVGVTQALARAFRNLNVSFPLLVLTDDYRRLDFVLVERYTDIATGGRDDAPGLTALTRQQVGVRPRVLTVNRSNPGDVALRVLRRFSYTEADAFAQYDKLLSAYIVADWSEPFFNNRALFSDHYLAQRLPESAEWKDAAGAAAMTRAFQALRDLYAEARETLVNQPASVTRRKLLEPALALLGFAPQAARAAATGRRGDEGVREPDYRLSAASGASASTTLEAAATPPGTHTRGVPTDTTAQPPVALCLAYPWGRYLDGKDDQRDKETAEENPGALVVSLLNDGAGANWAIVTNGKTWRLYSAKAHSRATNYYEIDLEEALAQPPEHREVAFRYFWHFFRAAAFVPAAQEGEGEAREAREAREGREAESACFLDGLVSESERYARELGERLKERVFFEVFPHFAGGFIRYARRHELLPAGWDALPEDERDRLLEPYFSGTLTFLYRLLFLLYAESRDLLPVREARGYHAHSLERLKHEIASKAGPIEDEAPAKLRAAYGEGSTDLYERLQTLFHAVDKGDAALNVPVYNGGLFVTNADAADGSPEAGVARFLAQYKIPDRQLALGLDRMARDLDEKKHDLGFIDYKSLGVRQLGSIYEGLLEFKLRIAPAEMAVVKGKKTEEIVPYAEALAKKLPMAREGRGKEARDRTLPKGTVYLENDRRERKATGSYYTPDYIVKYIVGQTVGPVLQEKLDALRPVFREAEKTLRVEKDKARALRRDDVSAERETYKKFSKTLNEAFFDLKTLDPAMGSGHFLVEAVDYITDRMADFLSAFRWNPVVYELEQTRRDIQNEMERQGISIDMGKLTDLNLLKRRVLKSCIYGVDLNLMAVELAKVSLWLDCFTLGAPLSFLDHHMKCGNSLIGGSVQEVQEAVSLGLWGSQFSYLLDATQLMRRVSELSDVTAQEVADSRSAYQGAYDAIAPFKRLLDVWTCEYFGIKGAKRITQDNTGAIFENDFRETDIGERQAIETALALAQSKRFFHWELEFPEVFFDESKRKENGGFDAVVGNPPYDVLAEKERHEDLSGIMGFFENALYLKPALGRKLDLYRLFTAQGINLTRQNGQISFIIPMSLLCDQQTENLRNYCLDKLVIKRINAFPQKDDPNRRVFYEAKLATCIPVFLKSEPKADQLPLLLIIHPGKLLEEVEGTSHLDYQQLKEIISFTGGIPLTRNDEEFKLLHRLYVNSSFDLVGKHLVTYQGEINETTHSGFLTEDSSAEVIVYRGSNVQRYVFFEEAKQGKELYLKEDDFKAQFNKGKYTHTTLKRFGYQRKAALDNWRRLIFGPLPCPSYCFESISYFLDEGVESLFFLSVLNSNLMEWRFGLTSTNNMVSTDEISSLPIRRINFTLSPDQRAYYLEKAKNLYAYCLEKDEQQCVLGFVDHHLAREPEESDAVHDLLAWLAEEMMRLNKEKRGLQKEFLDWLAQTLRIVPDKEGRAGIDALTGKARLADYPGDYQKGESPLATGELLEMLRKNKGRLGVSVSDAALLDRIGRVYEESLGRVLPLKEHLRKTDALIDAVVYRLYGLTEEEIKVVEGRG